VVGGPGCGLLLRVAFARADSSSIRPCREVAEAVEQLVLVGAEADGELVGVKVTVSANVWAAART
jgi:hypothetical protein